MLPARASALALLLAAVLPACALGLDFGELDNTCEPPRFDFPAADAFCSGELVALDTYQPLSQTTPNAASVFLTSVSVDGFVATAALSFFDGTGSCIEVIPGIDIGRLQADGEINPFSGINSADLGIRIPLAGGCPDGVEYVWPTEIIIHDTDPLVHVVAAFGDAGVLDLRVDADSGLPFAAYHTGGDGEAPTRRECLAGACVTSATQWCRTTADCHPLTYCADGSCVQLGACTLDGQCAVDDQSCATRRGACTQDCTSDLECPHPYTCVGGRCGGGGCTGDVACLQGDEICAIDACLTTCEGSAACPRSTDCFPLADDVGVCATGGRHGRCNATPDCSLGRVLGLAHAPGNALTFDLDAFVYATGNNLRLGLEVPGLANPYLIPGEADTEAGYDAYTDVLYVEDYGAAYASVSGVPDESGDISSAAIIRFDWDDVPAGLDGPIDAADYTRLYEIALEPDTRLVALRRVGGFLVTLERGAVGDDTEVFSRVLILDADRDTDLRAAFEGALALGRANQASVGPLPSSPDIWVWGLDRTDGAELIFYDMSDPSEPERLGELPVDTIDGQEREFVSVTEAGILVGGTAGITPLELRLDDD